MNHDLAHQRNTSNPFFQSALSNEKHCFNTIAIGIPQSGKTDTKNAISEYVRLMPRTKKYLQAEIEKCYSVSKVHSKTSSLTPLIIQSSSGSQN